MGGSVWFEEHLRWREQRQQVPEETWGPGGKGGCDRRKRRREGGREASWVPWGLAGLPAAAF